MNLYIDLAIIDILSTDFLDRPGVFDIAVSTVVCAINGDLGFRRKLS